MVFFSPIISEIGKPIDHPKAAAAGLVMKQGHEVSEIENKVHSIVDYNLENITKITEDFVAGKIKTY